MAKKKKRKYGKTKTPEQFRKNLVKLESVFGQKELAKKLGVNPSTLRRWKSGTSTPSKDKITKTNRIYGHNKQKVTFTGLKKKARQTQRRKQAYDKKHKIVTDSTRAWVESTFDQPWIMESILNVCPEFVAYPRGNARRVQFVTADDIGSERYGKQPSTRFVTIYGLYTRDYLQEGDDDDDISKSDFIPSRMGLLVQVNKHWELDKTLDYLEEKFMSTVKNLGRKKFTPTLFIGFKL